MCQRFPLVNLGPNRTPFGTQVRSFFNFALEVQRARELPSSTDYYPLVSQSRRFADRNLGTGLKTCARRVKDSPGPGSYNPMEARAASKNFMVLNGWHTPQKTTKLD